MKQQLLLAVLFLSSFTNAQSWTQIDAPTTATINSCSFPSENIGWIVTDDAIFHTSDGGSTWTNQFYPVAPANNHRQFKTVHFINENVGIIACNNILEVGYNPELVSSILWTNNGGEDWVYKNLGAHDYNDNDAKLINPLTAFTIGKAGSFKKTTDGGESWTNYDYNSNSISAGLRLSAVNESTVFFGGIQNGFIHYGTFGKTFDGGSNWLVTNAAPSAITSVYFFDDTKGWLGGYSGLLKHTTDAGASWDVATTGVDGTITDINFIHIHGWAATDLGQIITTVNEGVTWDLDYGGNLSVNSIAMTSPNEVGYAVGDEGLILKHNSTLSAQEHNITSSFTVSPNPAKDILNLTFEVPQSNSKLIIYNAVGQIVNIKDNMNGTKFAIDIQTLANGIYFMQLSDRKNANKLSKFVVAHN